MKCAVLFPLVYLKFYLVFGVVSCASHVSNTFLHKLIWNDNFFIFMAKFGCHQCSRLKPSYEFHFEGLSNFSLSVKGLAQIQDVNPRI